MGPKRTEVQRAMIPGRAIEASGPCARAVDEEVKVRALRATPKVHVGASLSPAGGQC